MADLLSEQDGPYIPPQVEDVGKAFIEWAEKYWDIEKAYTLLDQSRSPNSESAPWNYLRDTFIRQINELAKNKKPSGIEPGYYQIRSGNSINPA